MLDLDKAFKETAGDSGGTLRDFFQQRLGMTDCPAALLICRKPRALFYICLEERSQVGCAWPSSEERKN
jgi:hypothetical protein